MEVRNDGEVEFKGTPEEFEEMIEGRIQELPQTEEEYMKLMAEQALKDQERLKQNPTEPMATKEDDLPASPPSKEERDPCMVEYRTMVSYLEAKYKRKMRLFIDVVFVPVEMIQKPSNS